MADGRWTMTEEELNNVAIGMNESNIRKLPNFRKEHKRVDNRDGNAEWKCAFCGSENVAEGFGGYGNGLGYLSVRCMDCGGMTDLIYMDENGKFFV